MLKGPKIFITWTNLLYKYFNICYGIIFAKIFEELAQQKLANVTKKRKLVQVFE
jgi:hypothetical protein